MRLNNRSKGILCIISAAFCFALMNLFIRLSGDIPTMEKSFFRNVVAAIIAFFALLKSKQSFKSKKGNFKYLFMRAFFGTIGLFSNFYAIDHMNISDASMLNKLSPFFAIIFSVFLLKEYADVVEWILVIAAFLGGLLVIKPGFNSDLLPALIGLTGGLTAGIAYTYVRKLGSLGENNKITILFFSVFSCIVCIPFIIADFVPMTKIQLLFLILTGIAAAGGQFSITAAYTYAPAKEISVFDYSQVIFAAIFGMLFLDQLPDIVSVLGYAVIIIAAVIKWRYGIVKEKKNLS